jgi:FkbM family methyltransferase
MRVPSDRDMRLIAAFFGNRKGHFVEVGANEPWARSQTYHLEQTGWTGVLIEPQAQLAARLCAERRAKIFAVACSSPDNAGKTLPLYVAGPLSSLDRTRMASGVVPETVIEVPVRTLDSVLEEAGAATDFLFIDVEGHELEVLRGFDIARWRPRLLLLEDHVADLSKHRYLKAVTGHA